MSIFLSIFGCSEKHYPFSLGEMYIINTADEWNSYWRYTFADPHRIHPDSRAVDHIYFLTLYTSAGRIGTGTAFLGDMDLLEKEKKYNTV